MTPRNDLHFYSPEDEQNPLRVGNRKQDQYLFAYLKGLGVQTIIEETVYFDRDFLSEYTALYGSSTLGFPNYCRRLHFFAADISPADLEQALADDEASQQKLQESYRGFTVRRPLPKSPFGRTVLAWYPDHTPQVPRVAQPSRWYTTHLCGMPLRVWGLAWQQQDGGVSACASVAIWTILHSSAFSDSHAIPTTAEITLAANHASSSGKRIFPSGGLNQGQMADAIRASKLDPMIIDPLIVDSAQGNGLFSQKKFARACSALLRSGYPVLIVVRSAGEVHAVCAVGFRDVAVDRPNAGQQQINDDLVTHFYIHDDNLGPSVRYRLETTQDTDSASGQPTTFAHLVPEAPAGKDEVFTDLQPIVPLYMMAAVHQDMRLNITDLHDVGELFATTFLGIEDSGIGLNISTKIIRCTDYLEQDISQILAHQPSEVRARTRQALAALPLSLHIGIVRVFVGAEPLADLVIDTTAPRNNTTGLCHVLYNPFYSKVFQRYTAEVLPAVSGLLNVMDIGERIQAW